MPILRLVTNEAGSADYTSASTQAWMAPDNYGTFIVTHSGSRLASTSTVSLFLQGSLDGGATWFDIQTLKPSDTAYVNGNLASWCTVVPLANLVRVKAVNASGLTLNAWLID
jgi:hypothetical protein